MGRDTQFHGSVRRNHGGTPRNLDPGRSRLARLIECAPPSHGAALEQSACAGDATPMLDNVLATLDGRKHQSLVSLTELLPTPSGSTKPDHQPAMLKCAPWLSDQ